MRGFKGKTIESALVVALIITFCSSAWADPVPVSLVPADFASLLGGQASPIGLQMVSDLSQGTLHVDVLSQAFGDGNGHYLYLYQPQNTGLAGDNAVDAFTLGPVFGATGSTTLGYLTANVPSGFSLGDRVSAGASVDALSGPTVSFGFPGWAGQSLNAGQSSKTLYLLSDQPPSLILANLIDHYVGSGPVVGPVPEPATLSLLALGGLAMLRRKAAK